MPTKLQPEIDGITERLFNDPIEDEISEHHDFLCDVMSANNEALSIQEAMLLLSKVDQICIMVTTFYLLAKIRGENLDDVADELRKALLKNLMRRAILESPLSENLLN